MPPITRYFLLLILSTQIPSAQAEEEDELKIRARENFEIITITSGDSNPEWRYASPSHTFNIWYEDPFNFAWGFATGPFVVAYKEVSGQENRPSNLGASMKLMNHGIEAKWWYLDGLFIRGGGYVHQFNSNAGVREIGYGFLGGLGYEYNWDGIGLAVETDVRRLRLFKEFWLIRSQMVAIGVHFYDWF